MPEGHTLRRLADDLSAAFACRPVRVSSPQGRFAADAALIDGQPMLGADSAGKHLFVEFPGERYVHVHLGLIGKFDLSPAPAGIPVGQVRLRLQNDTTYADLRGATQCELIGREKHDQIIASLGPDPLRPDADPMVAWARIGRSHRPIGDLLMDQKVLAGVGNVYRAEVLYRHRVHPLRPGNTLRVGQFRAMWDDLVELMREGVRTGRIDTVRHEHTPDAMGRAPRVDDHGGEVYVYRRTGQPCLVCGSKVRTQELVGRNLFWCPRCQPTFRSRAVR
jgi:endonuclease-8